MTSGPLSSSHANFGDDCAKCHTPFGQVEDAKCSICHKKNLTRSARSSPFAFLSSPVGQYSFQSHYLYRSDSLTRSRNVSVQDEEQPCRACHTEHRGSDFKLSHVANSMCASCHFESFTEDHPDFFFARTAAADDSALKFTHIKHVAEVRKLHHSNNPSLQYSKSEQTCAYCHEPEPNGKLFKPISFDRHCSACHLQNTLTQPLTLADDETPGVLMPEDILARNEVAGQWVRASNPNDFRLIENGRVQKRVQHRDPWLLYNLANSDTFVTELVAISNTPFSDREALSKLQYTAQLLRLNRDPELHKRLSQADSALRQLQNSNAPKLQSFINPKVLPSSPLAMRIAKPCLECHMLSDGKILWVNGEQELLRRANFDHSAHIVQRDCLGCHFKIDVEKVAPDTLLSVRQDRASVLNLPEITTCRQCHAEEKATTDCMRCHEFHP